MGTSGVIGQSAAFGVEFDIREKAGRWEVVQRRNVKGARWSVCARRNSEAEAKAAYDSLVSLASYYAGGLSDRFAQRMEAGEFRIVNTQVAR